MGRVEGIDQDVGVPVRGEPIFSCPPASPPYQPQNVNQPNSSYPPQKVDQFPASVGNPWSTGLFDCQLDQTNAIITTVFPCVTFVQIAEFLEEGEMSCPLGSFIYMLMMPALCSNWIFGSKYRAKLRKKYDLVEAPYEAGMSHLFCPCCSLSQEYRELKLRGLDPALGWKGFVAPERRMKYEEEQVQNPPPFQTMSM